MLQRMLSCLHQLAHLACELTHGLATAQALMQAGLKQTLAVNPCRRVGQHGVQGRVCRAGRPCARRLAAAASATTAGERGCDDAVRPCVGGHERATRRPNSQLGSPDHTLPGAAARPHHTCPPMARYFIP